MSAKAQALRRINSLPLLLLTLTGNHASSLFITDKAYTMNVISWSVHDVVGSLELQKTASSI